jgi:hypothetical protein
LFDEKQVKVIDVVTTASGLLIYLLNEKLISLDELKAVLDFIFLNYTSSK